MNHHIRFADGFAASVKRAGASDRSIDSALERAYQTLNLVARDLPRGQSVTVPVSVRRRLSENQIVIRCQVKDSLVEAEEVVSLPARKSSFEIERDARFAQIAHRPWSADLIPLIMAA